MVMRTVMTAFLVVDTKIETPEAYEEYKAKARPIIEKFGGRYRARGGRAASRRRRQSNRTSTARSRLCAIPTPSRRSSSSKAFR
jgi:uncharacterized protein (DUF1330 family)